jgi:hypothetical protein
MSVIRIAEQYFSQMVESGRKHILNTDLHEHVGRVSGQHRSVVHGTLDSMGPGSLYAADWYQENWHKEFQGTRVVHVLGMAEEEETESDDHLKTILEGIEPDDLVITAEIDSEQLVRLHPSVKSIGVYEAPVEECKLFNANTGGGYASKKLVKFLQMVAKERQAEVVALTVLKLDNFRNAGAFQDKLRADYAWSADKHAQCISDQMEGYEMTNRFVFRRKTNSMPLETFVFVREG